MPHRRKSLVENSFRSKPPHRNAGHRSDPTCCGLKLALPNLKAREVKRTYLITRIHVVIYSVVDSFLLAHKTRNNPYGWHTASVAGVELQPERKGTSYTRLLAFGGPIAAGLLIQPWSRQDSASRSKEMAIY